MKTVRKVCNLPTRATTNYVFADRRWAVWVCWIPTGMLTIKQSRRQSVSLSSPDDTVRGVATQQLTSVVRRTLHRVPTAAGSIQFMSGSMEGDLANFGWSGQISTLWSRAGTAARRLRISLSRLLFRTK